MEEQNLSKKQLKEMRRKIQEEQRAKKLEKKSTNLKVKGESLNTPISENKPLANKQEKFNDEIKTSNLNKNIKLKNHNLPTCFLDSENLNKKLNRSRTLSSNVYQNKPSLNYLDDSKVCLQQEKADPTAELSKVDKQVKARIAMDDPKYNKKLKKKLHREGVPEREENTRKMPFFHHLKQYDRPYMVENRVHNEITEDVILTGLKFSEEIIRGANARAISFIQCLRNFIINYRSKKNTQLSRTFELALRPCISYLNQCRQNSIGNGNIIRYLKGVLVNSYNEVDDEKTKHVLLENLNSFLQNRIIKPYDQIVSLAKDLINDDDVIITFSSSSLITKTLEEAYHQKKNFKLIIVDSKPRYEGLNLLNKLSGCKIRITYCNIRSVGLAIKRATKVFLGAHAVLNNGAIMSRVGSALLTVTAKHNNVPVIVLCETYKFSDRAQTDAIVFNELADPNDLINSSMKDCNLLKEWKDYENVSIVNLVYDVIQSDLVSGIVTEIGIIPCASAPIVVREKNKF